MRKHRIALVWLLLVSLPLIALITGCFSGKEGVEALASTAETRHSYSAPSRPNLVLPLHQALNIPTQTVLEWQASTGATPITYDVYFGTRSSPTLASSNLTVLSWSTPLLLSNTKYYWKVVAKNSSGSTSSTIRYFTTAKGGVAPSRPNLTTPLNGASGVSTQPQLQWQASTGTASITYDVYLSTRSSPSLATSNLSVLNWTPPSLSANTKYYWKVVAKNSAGSTSSTVRSFTTARAGVLPSTPVLSSPSNAATNIPTQTQLQWQAASGTSPISYDVYFGTASTPPLVASNLSVLSWSTPLLNGNTKYYWKIVAKNTVGTASSTTRSFTTKSTSTVQYTVTALSSPTSGGEVRINAGAWGDSSSVTVNSGIQVTVEASPESGYVFEGWYEGSTRVSQVTPFSFNATGNRTLKGSFRVTSTGTQKSILIYNGSYSAEGCAEAVAKVAQDYGLTISYFSDPKQIVARLNTTSILAIGGTEDNIDPFILSFTPDIVAAIKTYLQNGGHFLGICGGAYLASSGWEESYGFVPAVGLVDIETDSFLYDSRPIVLTVKWKNVARTIYYQYGPVFLVKDMTGVQVIALYSDNRIAVLSKSVGNGKVYLAGPHPEADASWIESDVRNGAAWRPTADLARDMMNDIFSGDAVEAKASD